jgi:RNA polymerase sigma-70 factor (ECF subfamily)
MSEAPTDALPARDPLEGSYVAVAQAGNRAEFGDLIEPFRLELQVYCYRLLGSSLDAEDMVQETMLRAWRRRATFNQPISFRAWLYKIATNTCLNALEKRPRRTLPTALSPAADAREAAAGPLDEPIWLEPMPDEWLAGDLENPETTYPAHETVSIGFMVLLQLLPRRQRAVFVLRDLLDWQAEETARVLGLTVSSVNSALHRARATITKHSPKHNREATPLSPDDPGVRELLQRYVHAWENADVPGLVSMLRDDAILTMPPIPTWYQGAGAIAAVLATGVFAGQTAGGEWRLLAARANGQPALAIYHRGDEDKTFHPFTFQVLSIDLTTGRIAALINFLNPAILACFGLPAQLESGT